MAGGVGAGCTRSSRSKNDKIVSLYKKNKKKNTRGSPHSLLSFSLSVVPRAREPVSSSSLGWPLVVMVVVVLVVVVCSLLIKNQ